MNGAQIRRVMQKYGKAWETQDSTLILECFTKTGVYQESQLTNPYRGHKEIKRFWDKVVCKETSHIKFKLGKIDVSADGQTGFAQWECTTIYKGEKHHMVGIAILNMKGNKISYLNEYWNTKVLYQSRSNK